MAVTLDAKTADAEAKENIRRAKSLFDQITEASYTGMAFRNALANNPEAMKAAQTLVDAILDTGVKLSTPDYKSERTWYIMDSQGKAAFWTDNGEYVKQVFEQGHFVNDDDEQEWFANGSTLRYLTIDEFVHFNAE